MVQLWKRSYGELSLSPWSHAILSTILELCLHSIFVAVKVFDIPYYPFIISIILAIKSRDSSDFLLNFAFKLYLHDSIVYVQKLLKIFHFEIMLSADNISTSIKKEICLHLKYIYELDIPFHANSKPNLFLIFCLLLSEQIGSAGPCPIFKNKYFFLLYSHFPQIHCHHPRPHHQLSPCMYQALS